VKKNLGRELPAIARPLQDTEEKSGRPEEKNSKYNSLAHEHQGEQWRTLILRQEWGSTAKPTWRKE